VRILLDATAGAREHCSGIGRYVQRLVAALDALPEDFTLARGVRFGRLRAARYLPPAPRHGQGGVRWLHALTAPLVVRRGDVVHGLDARLYGAPRARTVVTLHDVFSLERTDLAAAGFRARKQERYREIATRADRILCVSAATRDAYVAAFPEAADRTRVVHHGVDGTFRPAPEETLAAVRARLGLPRRFLLFVGLLSTRKNLVTLVEAFAPLAAADPELHLVLAGRPSHGHEAVAAAVQASPARDRIHCPGFVADADLPALYQAAELFVFPSLTEGFGLPVLEALAVGTPVVTSDLPVCREVGGAHVACADPGDPADLARVIDAALRHPDPAARRRAGREWAARFTWEETARQTFAVYRELAS